MKKLSMLLAALTLMILTAMTYTQAFAADVVTIPIQSTNDVVILPFGEVYIDYSVQLRVTDTDGSDITDYCSFELYEGLRPSAMTVSGTGMVTIPAEHNTLAGTFASIELRITDTRSDTAYLHTVQLNIDPKHVILRVSATTSVYDAKPHPADASYYEMDGVTKLDSPVPALFYNGLSEPIAAGSYHIDYQTYADGVLVEQYEGDEFLYIDRAPAPVLDAEDKTFEYDGNKKGYLTSDVTVTTTLPDTKLSLGIEYRRLGSAEEYTTEQPSASGVYSVRIYSKNSNFDPAEITRTLTITGQSVSFTVKDNTHEYDKLPHYADVSIADGEPVTGFSVSYTTTVTNEDGSTEVVTVEHPTNAGTYTINITLDDPDGFTAAPLNPSALIITPKPVDFEVTNNVIDSHNTPATATVTCKDSDLTYGTDFNVHYRDIYNEVSDTVSHKGKYDVLITVTNTNYTVIDSFAATVTVEGIELAFGNSPAALIFRDRVHDSAWKDAALTSLINNKGFVDGYIPDVPGVPDSRQAEFEEVLKQVTYNTQYGEDETMDGDYDKYTLIITDKNNFTDPGLIVDGEKLLYTTMDDHGDMLTLHYEHAGNTFDRIVFVVPALRTGDINGDNNVNAIDASYLEKHMAEINADNDRRVERRRFWDVNMDGTVDKSDADAIRRRYNNPLMSYYPWLNIK